MPRPKIRVRSKTSGLVADVSPDALRHFPDYEPVDAGPEASVEPGLPPEAVEPKPSTRRSTAAKSTEEE